jgi:predicted unusual protein kinase regulating ubiquinone biosynthesis (AarF/ABC1/UbiB family)
VTQVLLDFVDATENNGLKFPREFGLLVKQSLYFDRYLKILAPNLDVMWVSVLGSESSTTSLSPSRTSGNNSNFDGDIIDVEVA